MKYALMVFITAVVLLSLIDSFKQRIEDRDLVKRAESSSKQLATDTDQQRAQFGYSQAIGQFYRFSTSDLQAKISQLSKQQRHRFYMWSTSDKKEFVGSASGVDGQAYFANSFLLGFQPFKTKTVWEPLATLALRKSYLLDHHLYGPNSLDIWQNSKQAYRHSHGDCEDHAILLADWLLSAGHDARVALGEYRGGGHAWVLLRLNGKDYILESTTKRKPRSINDFILAKRATDYRPMYQFDRTRFWVNTGSKLTTNYRDKKWQMRSTFTRQS